MADKRELLIKLSSLLSAKRKLTGNKSFSNFCNIYLKGLMNVSSAPFHDEMKGLIDKTINGNEIIHRLLFIAPRGFAKSTICSVMFPLYLAIYGKRHDIFLVSATISLAKELLRKVRKELETNEKILKDFGELKSDKWTEDILVLKNGTIIRAKGRGFQIRGFRPDIIICDDLEDEEIIYSKEQREKLENWFFRTLLPALKPDQTLMYVGTKIHNFSLITKLQEKEEFIAKMYKALTDSVSIWETLWPTEALLKIRREIGTYAFEAEYQNNPISLTEQPIKPHMLEGVSIKGNSVVTCLAIDPAISEKTSADYRAFVILERTEDGFREIFSERGKWGIEEQVDRIVELYERYKPTRVVIEEIAFQKVYRPLIMKAAKAKGLFVPISEAKMGRDTTTGSKRPKDKYTRLMSVVHLFEQRLVELKNPELIDECLAFPQGDHDDLVDACVHSLYWLLNFRQGAGLTKRKDVSLPITVKDSFYVHEVRPGVFMARIGQKPPPKQKSSFINLNAV